MGFTKLGPERKYLRPDTTIDQRTFDEHGKEVGLDNQTHDEIWADVLSLGKQFGRNIADALLGKARQTRRGEILVTRSEASQDTRSIPYRAKKYELPNAALPHAAVESAIPRENERRSHRTARRTRHSRANFPIPQHERPSANRKLAAGGFMTNFGKEYELLALMEERAAAYQAQEKERRKGRPATDDIKF